MREQLSLFDGQPPAVVDRGAVLSPCGRYRYRLWRIWDDDLAPTAFVMLNPSTADATLDDPTIRRCVGFARSWGSGGIVVVNLFAFRATDPAALFGVQSAENSDGNVGPENDEHIRRVFSTVDSVVCAWGAHALAIRRGQDVLAMVPQSVEVSCLGTTKDGAPKHPLYLRADTARVPFGGRRG